MERLRCSPDIFVSVSPGFSAARNAAGRVNLRAQAPVGFKVSELMVNLADRAGRVDFQWRPVPLEIREYEKDLRFGRKTRLRIFRRGQGGRTNHLASLAGRGPVSADRPEVGGEAPGFVHEPKNPTLAPARFGRSRGRQRQDFLGAKSTDGGAIQADTGDDAPPGLALAM